MAAARRRTCEGKRSELVHPNPPPSRRLRLRNAHPRVCLAPQLTWSRGRDPERPRIAAPWSVPLLLVLRFLARCLPLGVPVSPRGPRDSGAEALGRVSGQREPCGRGRETFTPPGALLGAPRSPARPAPTAYPPPSPDRSFLPHAGGRSPLGRLGGGGLNQTQLSAKRLRLSRSRPPRPESPHPSGAGGWGAPRLCSGGGGGGGCFFFHHPEDVRAGIAGSPAAPRLRLARKDPAHSSWLRSPGPQRSLARAAHRTRRFWPARYRGRGSLHRGRHRRAKPEPGRTMLPDPPTPGGCGPRPASARLLPGGAGLVRAAVCRRGSSPRARPSSAARPAPAPWQHGLPPPPP